VGCPGLTPEDYRLYELGLAETSEADRIQAHLQDGCESCIAELRSGAEFWYRFAVVGAEVSTAEPRLELRAEILESVARSRSRSPRAWNRSWPKAVTATITIVTISVFSWYAGHRGWLGQRRTVELVATQLSDSGRPQQDVAALRERLQRAEQALAARAKPSSVAPVPVPSSDVATLQQALAEVRRALADAQQGLDAQQARAAALQSDLQTQSGLLADAVRERQSAEDRVRGLAEAQSVADERQRQIRTLTSRVQQLESENSEYRSIIDRQRRDIEHTLRFASLLDSPSLAMVKLQPTEKGALAVGYAFVEGSRVVFYASNLPDLPAGRTYQLWLIRGRAPAIVSGGLFAAGGRQHAIVELRDPLLASHITALAVTDEPAKGSPLPTGHKFLIGSLRS
jgi:Anti-sigma-K factor rskA